MAEKDAKILKAERKAARRAEMEKRGELPLKKPKLSKKERREKQARQRREKAERWILARTTSMSDD